MGVVEIKVGNFSGNLEQFVDRTSGALRYLVPIYSICYLFVYSLFPSQKFSYRAYLGGGAFTWWAYRQRNTVYYKSCE